MLKFMRKLMTGHAALVLVTVGFVVAALAAPTLAGTVYSWTTEDGTAAFTDDPKRIPARYRSQARARELGKLKDYERFSESKVARASAERTSERLERLRSPRLPAVSAPPPYGRDGVRMGVGIASSRADQLSFPMDAASDEPFVTSERRVRTRASIATQDMRITRQGDKVISVQISAPNQRKISDGAGYR